MGSAPAEPVAPGRVVISPPAVALRWAFVGIVAIIAGLLLGAATWGDRIVPGDLTIARAMQAPQSAALDRVAIALSWLGTGIPTAALVIVVVLSLVAHGRRDLALFVLLAVACRAVGSGLKWLIGSSRPPASALALLEHASGFGFPSGHALAATLFYGAIAVIAPYVFERRWLAYAVQIVAVLLFVLISLARVRVGAHWPSDIAGGMLLGAGFVCLLHAGLLTWWNRQCGPLPNAQLPG
jgi:membrane-associated phospholipid phosphatase